jgi:hypothetical protein
MSMTKRIADQHMRRQAFRLPQVVIDHVDPHFLAEAGEIWDELKHQEHLLYVLHDKAKAAQAKLKQEMAAAGRLAEAAGDGDWDGWEFQRAIDFYEAVEDVTGLGSSSAADKVEKGYQYLAEALYKADRRNYNY